jgi:hypothetical protein
MDHDMATINKEFWEREDKLRDEDVKGWVAHADAVIAEAERSDKANAELAEAQAREEQKAREKLAAEFKATADNIQRTLSSALVQGFMEGGRSGGEILKRAIESAIASAFLTPLISPMLAPVGQLGASLGMSLAGSFWGGSGAAAGSAAALDSAAGFGSAAAGGTAAAAGASAAGFSWAPPLAAGAGLAYLYQSGAANRSFPVFGKLGNAIDSIFPGVGTALGMGGGRGPKSPQMGVLQGPDGRFYISQMNSGDEGYASTVLAPLSAQLNDRTKYDPANARPSRSATCRRRRALRPTSCSPW